MNLSRKTALNRIACADLFLPHSHLKPKDFREISGREAPPFAAKLRHLRLNEVEQLRLRYRLDKNDPFIRGPISALAALLGVE